MTSKQQKRRVLRSINYQRDYYSITKQTSTSRNKKDTSTHINTISNGNKSNNRRDKQSEEEIDDTSCGTVQLDGSNKD